MNNDATEVRNGLLVEHATFGLGKIVEVGLQTILVHFRDDTQDVRKLSIGRAPLTVAENQSDARLDCLPAFSEGKFDGKKKRVGLSEAIDQFRQRCPKGFEDPAYIGTEDTGERTAKWSAHERYEKAFGGGVAEELLAAGDVAELAQRMERFVVSTKMLSKFEAIALRDGLREEAPAVRYFQALLAFLQAEPEEASFNALASALEGLPAKAKARAASWPVLTLVPFLARPDRFMLLKPDITIAGAHRLRFDVQYDAALRWITYHNLMTLSTALLEELRPLGARDFIDVHSFLSVIAAV
jgi:hypothetical protein